MPGMPQKFAIPTRERPSFCTCPSGYAGNALDSGNGTWAALQSLSPLRRDGRRRATSGESWRGFRFCEYREVGNRAIASHGKDRPESIVKAADHRLPARDMASKF
jgi:hypothetical protein